jgi:uncharacterized membrane protein YidH (DUF202 family)
MSMKTRLDNHEANFSMVATINLDARRLFSLILFSCSFFFIAPVFGQNASPSPAPSPPPASMNLVTVLLLCFVTLLLIGVIVWQWNKAPQAKDDDKALEGLRIIYGFWLIVVALLVSLLVLFITLATIRISQDLKTTDIVAIIGTVTGLITTLVAAFFGIQQAGAGRSQAMTALAQLRGPGPDGAGVSKLEPAYGPHSGGTKLSITGNGFTGASAVNIGAIPGTNFKFENDGLVTVNSPPAPPKTDEAKVAMVFPGTSPPNREVGTFYYYTIDPPHGPAAGQTPVKILGSGLKEVCAVKFGATNATNLTPLNTDSSGSEFRGVTAPAGTAGSDVTVELMYPVESNLRTFVIGTYHYD